MQQITVFSLEKCLLGVESSSIHMVQPIAPFIKMPQKQDGLLLLGMMKLPDGSFAHVINSAALLGLERSTEEEAKVIVFKSGELLLGLIVNSSISIMRADEAAFETVLPISKINTEYFSGTVLDSNNDVVLLLNMEKVLATLTASSQNL